MTETFLELLPQNLNEVVVCIAFGFFFLVSYALGKIFGTIPLMNDLVYMSRLEKENKENLDEIRSYRSLTRRLFILLEERRVEVSNLNHALRRKNKQIKTLKEKLRNND